MRAQQLHPLYYSDHGTLYIGNISAALSLKTLQKNKINAVITVANGAFLPHTQQQLPNYMYIPAEDVEYYDLSAYFVRSYDFINKNLMRTNVMIHSINEDSRSATIAIAFLMRKNRKTFKEVYSQVYAKIKCNPNAGFIRQLKDYEIALELHFQKLNQTETQLKIVESNRSNISQNPQKITQQTPVKTLKRQLSFSREHSTGFVERTSPNKFHSVDRNLTRSHHVEKSLSQKRSQIHENQVQRKIQELRKRILETEKKSKVKAGHKHCMHNCFGHDRTLTGRAYSPWR